MDNQIETPEEKEALDAIINQIQVNSSEFSHAVSRLNLDDDDNQSTHKEFGK